MAPSFSLRAALLAGLLSSVTATPFRLSARDLLTPLGANPTSEQEKYCPSIDYDTDSCYNVAAISPTGQLNAGQDPNKGASTVLGLCRKEERLSKGQIYARSKCNGGWCAHMYDYYFESDIGFHRHDWEHIVVWVQNNAVKFVSVSAHGKWDVRYTYQDPKVRMGDTHAKVVYHKDGAFSRCFRFAGSGDEPPENHWQSWRWGAGAGLINWDWMPANIRTALNNKDWGSAEMSVRDKDGSSWNFNWYLDESRKICYSELMCGITLAPEFNAWA